MEEKAGSALSAGRTGHTTRLKAESPAVENYGGRALPEARVSAEAAMNIERQSVQHRYEIVGRSPLVREAIDRVIQVAPTDLTVLVTGESGTGKEVFAKAIHGMSKRRHQPLVSVNCGAIPATLLEAELFGHERGAFTGAVEQRHGFFEAAHRGTIFLDELGEMPLDTQVKLLRVLETGEYSRVGSSEIRRVDVRIIAATNRELDEEIRRGAFRHDLFFRLNTVRITLPALRNHPEDVPLLVEYFARKTATKLGISFEGVAPEAMRMLMNLPWPGNVRELKNMIGTIVTLEKGQIITPAVLRPYIPLALKAPETPEHTAQAAPYSIVPVARSQKVPEPSEIYQLLLEIRSDVDFIKTLLLERNRPALPEASAPQPTQAQTAHRHDDMPQTLRIDEMERKLIAAALQLHAGNRRQAARSLGISERTLYRKLKEYGLLEE